MSDYTHSLYVGHGLSVMPTEGTGPAEAQCSQADGAGWQEEEGGYMYL